MGTVYLASSSGALGVNWNPTPITQVFSAGEGRALWANCNLTPNTPHLINGWGSPSRWIIGGP
jgi:hypothetical protein